ncbi:EKA-like protein [Blumeria hordei DH14]|uniref:EKA-like protein n=1 Tax=Blumeria graminis f. sp. hordei (strain DH14) TaxID=546991 RepID=N1J4P2_BLUG1|nr:EKA-like protein [Blumeria hordei DH14]
MPPTCKPHKNAVSGTAKDRVNKTYQWNTAIQNHARNMLTRRGLESNLQNMNTIAAALLAKEYNVPEVEMVDAEVDRLKTLANSIWASSSPENAEQVFPALPRLEEVRPSKGAEIITNKASTDPEIVAEKVVSSTTTEPAHVAARKIAVPLAKRTTMKNTAREMEVMNCAEATNASRPQPPPTSIPGIAEYHNHSSGGAPTGTTPIHPPEIEALLEAERKRAANTSARL